MNRVFFPSCVKIITKYKVIPPRPFLPTDEERIRLINWLLWLKETEDIPVFTGLFTGP